MRPRDHQLQRHSAFSSSGLRANSGVFSKGHIPVSKLIKSVLKVSPCPEEPSDQSERNPARPYENQETKLAEMQHDHLAPSSSQLRSAQELLPEGQSGQWLG